VGSPGRQPLTQDDGYEMPVAASGMVDDGADDGYGARFRNNEMVGFEDALHTCDPTALPLNVYTLSPFPFYMASQH
jgi:hypothetical protein